MSVHIALDKPNHMARTNLKRVEKNNTFMYLERGAWMSSTNIYYTWEIFVSWKLREWCYWKHGQAKMLKEFDKISVLESKSSSSSRVYSTILLFVLHGTGSEWNLLEIVWKQMWDRWVTWHSGTWTHSHSPTGDFPLNFYSVVILKIN